jgi:hypothetical protein
LKAPWIVVGTLAVLLAVRLPGPAAAGALTEVDLGEVPFEDTGVAAVDVAVEAPEGSTGLLLHCGGFGDEAVGTVQRILAPDGSVYFDAEHPSGVWRAEATDDGVTVLLPLVPRGTVAAGTWTVSFVVGTPRAAHMRCRALQATGEGSGQPTLRLDVHLLGFPDGEAAHPGRPLRGLLRWLRRSLQAEGVALQVTLHDWEGADEATWEILDLADDDQAELNALLRTARPEDPRAIPVFVVQQITNHSRGAAQILGLSAGPPGGPAGTSKGGLVVNAMDLRFDPREVGRILEHELGHFLGLFHTTEKHGAAEDLLTDTPVCRHDADGDGVLESRECEEHGWTNVMWWTMGHVRAGFSEEQRWLLQHHPRVAP